MKWATEILTVSLLTGCLTAWVVVLLRKVGVAEWMQVHGPKVLGELMRCDYCQNWWLSWLVVLPMVVCTGATELLVVPFAATMVGRFLSN